jgi:hypothetical protein
MTQTFSSVAKASREPAGSDTAKAVPLQSRWITLLRKVI